MDCLSGIDDLRRSSNGITLHDFREILVMAIAVLSECNTVEDIVLRLMEIPHEEMIIGIDRQHGIAVHDVGLLDQAHDSSTSSGRPPLSFLALPGQLVLKDAILASDLLRDGFPSLSAVSRP